jgi:hypothetical protein
MGFGWQDYLESAISPKPHQTANSPQNEAPIQLARIIRAAYYRLSMPAETHRATQLPARDKASFGTLRQKD